MRYLIAIKDSAWQQVVFEDNKRQARQQIKAWCTSASHIIDEIIAY